MNWAWEVEHCFPIPFSTPTTVTPAKHSTLQYKYLLNYLQIEAHRNILTTSQEYGWLKIKILIRMSWKIPLVSRSQHHEIKFVQSDIFTGTNLRRLVGALGSNKGYRVDSDTVSAIALPCHKWRVKVKGCSMNQTRYLPTSSIHCADTWVGRSCQCPQS